MRIWERIRELEKSFVLVTEALEGLHTIAKQHLECIKLLRARIKKIEDRLNESNCCCQPKPDTIVLTPATPQSNS